MAKREYVVKDGQRFLVVPLNGHRGFVVRFTATCSGCSVGYEEGGDSDRGMGCFECGYTGKRRQEHWIPLDYTSWESSYDPQHGYQPLQ